MPYPEATAGGPLRGVRVVEFAGIGPAPFAAMVLADLGAEVVRIGRPGEPARPHDFMSRGKGLMTLDLKDPADRETARALALTAEVLIEGNRPGVMERLGLGPDDLLAKAPRLVYGRMTGWGQAGPLASTAGHDINYVAVTGMLDALGAEGRKPAIPLNLIGDLGGGAMFLVAGILAALFDAMRSGRGQVVDAAIVDGVNLFAGVFHMLRAQGRWPGRPGTNLLDGGAPFYDTYRCADGKYVAIGPLEPQFYAELLRRLDVCDPRAFQRDDRTSWPELKTMFARLFATRDRDAWCALLEGSDACFAPVLELDEVPDHPHHQAREAFHQTDGVLHPAPAPRFSATPAARPAMGEPVDPDDLLTRWSTAAGA
ncbi:CaiB/BaiF CoA transferase family protein [Tistrella mobilis]|uniref:CaiB/BaiF CoA transferase family protein n=1 Tax=Tistrella mobilis TaxID=171437 RepID=UPI0005A15E57|nr:CaiB/BaiF CoA-transferase family protein [Tistrella mobilis]